MKRLKKCITLCTLLLCGTILLAIGLSITLSPTGFYASSSISLGENPSLISELRAPAGMLIAAGLYILASVRVAALRAQAWLISTLIYLPYGAGRLIGFIFDGLPDTSIVAAAVIEIVLGVASLLMLIRFRVNQQPAGGRSARHSNQPTAN